jgi:ATP-binding cassette, subfamily B, bacterial PglK
MNTVQKMFGLLTKKERIQAAGLFMMFLLMSLAEVAGIASILPFMSVLSDPQSVYEDRWLKAGYEAFGFSGVNQYLFFIGLGVFAILIVTNVIKAITRWMTIYMTQSWGESLSRRLFDTYLQQSYRFFLDRNSSDISKNILAEVQILTNNVLMSFLDMSTKVIVLIAIMTFLAIINPVLAIAATVILGTVYVIVFFALKKSLKTQAHLRTQAQADKYKVVSEALQGIKNIKLGGYERLYSQYFAAPAERFSISNSKSSVISEIPKYALEIIAFGGILMMILYLLMESPEGLNKVLPVIALYVFAGYRLMPVLQGIYFSFTRMRFHKPVLDIIRRELDLNTEIKKSLVENKHSVSFQNHITLQNISFQYENGGKEILKDVNFVVPAGKTIGIVGKTGAGKTTLVDILVGLLKPTQGEIIVDDTLIRDDNRKAWQKNLSYVSQHIYLCDDSIKANIAFGLRNDEIDMDKISKVSQAACLSDFIENELPQKYDTIVGENGVRLSGGQRQRIGLARSLYLDRPVLVLDEATSALDPSTESEIMDSIYGLSEKKTIFIISHKLELLSKCDFILVVQDGRVILRERNLQNLNSETSFQEELKAHVSSVEA